MGSLSTIRGTTPGVIEPHRRIAATSVSARSGAASHSSRTRSWGNACLTTTALPVDDTRAAMTVAETPPGQLGHLDRLAGGSEATTHEVTGGIRKRQLEHRPGDATDRQNRPMRDLTLDPDGIARCGWCADDALYRSYHDDEWGRETQGDDAVFELLSLEGFQAGLSWLTILRKREGFRRAFAGFSIERVADFDERDVERLLTDAAIVRHRGKIEATIGNAAAALGLPAGLSELVWGHAPRRRSARPARLGELPAATPESTALSNELKQHGFRFVGPTTVYAFMQSAGIVDDHLEGCHVARGTRG